ncbi:NAD(P)H-dependent oxidoreductase [Candidatus Micrarchaeota archaeon]|nr:NAD(P)H-dependent oxidoreductase [Candidatus Micrarchaeota archaeon]
MYVPVILGTGREGRQSEKVARFILSEAAARGFESEILDVRDYAQKATDNTGKTAAARKLAEKVKNAAAVIIVSPEYNHGYPGELKMMLDLCYGEYAGKPLGICGVSSGPLGGARMVEQLRLVAVELRMQNMREALYFSSVQDMFDDSGAIKDKEAWGRRTKKFFDELSARTARGG